MADMDPIVLFAILRESFGSLFWPAVALVVVLAAGVLLVAVRIWSRGRGLRAGLLAALVVGAVVTALATLLVPAWTHAELGDLRSAVDVAAAVALALAPGAVAACIAFIGGGLIGSASR